MPQHIPATCVRRPRPALAHAPPPPDHTLVLRRRSSSDKSDTQKAFASAVTAPLKDGLAVFNSAFRAIAHGNSWKYLIAGVCYLSHHFLHSSFNM